MAEIGGYRLARLLGTGGQGSVYLGEGDAGLVAVKVLHEGSARDGDAMRRFLREAEIAQRVAPFSTARVLGAGVHEGRPYIISEYVPGPSLDLLVRQEGPRTGSALQRLAATTLSALAAIHRAGIVHRDFKPANVILGPEGPVVIDFGIARAVDQAGTRTGSLGTPAYMAPEQFGQGAVGQAADVFAWAGTMVFAATGHRPFPGETMPALLNAVLNAAPDVSGVPEPLLGAVLRCLDKDPRARPTADGLYALFTGHSAPPAPRPAPETVPVVPPPMGPPETVALLPPRRSRTVVWLAPVAVGLVAAAVAAFVFWPEGTGGPSEAGTPSVSVSAFGAPVGAPLLDHGNDIRAIAVGTVDGAAVAASGSDDQTVRLWRLGDGAAESRVLKGHTGWVRGVAFGSLQSAPVVVSASDDDTVRIWDASDGSELGVFTGHTGDVKAVAVGDVSRKAVAVSGGADGVLRVWNLADQVETARLSGHAGTIWSVALTELDGVPVAVSAGEDGTVRVWDLGTGAQRAVLTGHSGPVLSVAVLRVGGRALAATGGDDGTIRFWDLGAGTEDGGPINAGEGPIWAVAAGTSGGAPVVVSGGEDQTVRVWDAVSRAEIGEPFAGHTDRVWSVAFTDRTGSPLALSGSRDNTLRVWSLAR
ncbi:serine/threonine-protein kinase [Actinocorallia aurea]